MESIGGRNGTQGVGDAGERERIFSYGGSGRVSGRWNENILYFFLVCTILRIQNLLSNSTYMEK